MSDDDLIRRGDVENALRTDLRDDDATRLASAWALNRLRALPAIRERKSMTREEAQARTDRVIRMLAESDRAPRIACPKCYAEFPADPRAAAAIRLAESMSARRRCETEFARCNVEPDVHIAEQRWRDAVAENCLALAAWREIEEPKPQPEPAPKPCLPVDPDSLTHAERLAEIARMDRELRQKHGIQGGLGR